MYKPLQIKALQTHNTKNPPLNRPSKYKPPGALYLEIAFKYKVKLLSTLRVAQSILKHKFPSVDKPPRDYKPLKKGLWKI